ncbi:MAG: bifunctional riboflavin kinase/FAD synthetase [Pseudomonadota bacterium]
MSIKRIHNPDDFPESLKGGAVAIGNFDGVHRGHQAVLCAAVTAAQSNDVTANVLTFEPHPRTFFRPQAPVFRLTDAKTKAELLGQIGFSGVLEHVFDNTLSSLSAEAFIQDVLVDKMGVSQVITGYDFQFGKGREGTPEYLIEAGNRLGFTTTIVNAFSDEGGGTVSSSRIRECLACGEMAEANGLLGFAYRISGEVIKGKQLGRTLGYPTANVALPAEVTLAHGIYAVRVRLSDGTTHDGVASYGRRPTFDNGEALLESFLFDFSADLYGTEMTVYLHAWLRGEEKFDSVDALVEQMDRDSAEARSLLSSLAPDHGVWPVVTC